MTLRSRADVAGALSDQLSDDAFLGGRLKILQPRTGFRAGSTAVYLAAAVPAHPGQSVLELGCGVGAALFCLGARVSGSKLTGLELQPDYADLARRNAARNGVAAAILTGDVADPPGDLRQQAFDHVLMNPPFYPAATATAATDPGRDHAHRERHHTLAAFLDQGIRRLAPKGSLTLIYPPARLGEILAGIDRRLGAVTILPMAARPGDPAGRIILQGRKGARAPLRLLAPFITHDGPDLSPRAQTILRDSGALSVG